MPKPSTFTQKSGEIATSKRPKIAAKLAAETPRPQVEPTPTENEPQPAPAAQD